MAKPAVISLAVAAGVLLLAVVLNPSPERHRDKIQEAIGARSPIAKVLGVGALAAFASNYHSLGVASYTKVGDKTASWGAFGLVFVAQ